MSIYPTMLGSRQVKSQWTFKAGKCLRSILNLKMRLPVDMEELYFEIM